MFVGACVITESTLAKMVGNGRNELTSCGIHEFCNFFL